MERAVFERDRERAEGMHMKAERDGNLGVVPWSKLALAVVTRQTSSENWGGYGIQLMLHVFPLNTQS